MNWLTLLVTILCVLHAQSTPDRSPRIINGQASNLQPYNVYILYLNVNNAGFFGGGSIISPLHVLTSAQSIVGFVQWQVGMGSNTFSQLTTVVSSVATAHAEYNSLTKANDIGIVTLPTSLVFTAYVQPIALPPLVAQIDQLPLENEQGSVVGFGFTSVTSVAPSVNLLRAYLRVTNNLRCQQFYQITLPQHFCAENTVEFSNICNGDIGAGFVTDVGGTQTVTGIASLITESCGNSSPSGFTRVASYRQWIYSLTQV
ncbi:chymotrypsin-like [Armigeres subalbatus]|uniref:chymotrypsin-like n=1 Tax=Armigeres subalbatus TaxID=124917 RepID=UPI002ED62E53